MKPIDIFTQLGGCSQDAYIKPEAETIFIELPLLHKGVAELRVNLADGIATAYDEEGDILWEKAVKVTLEDITRFAPEKTNLSITSEQAKLIHTALSEQMLNHANPQSIEYFNCDKVRCSFCIEAKSIIKLITPLIAPTPK